MKNLSILPFFARRRICALPIPVDRHCGAQQVSQLFRLFSLAYNGVHRVPHGGRVLQEAVAGLDGLGGIGGLGGPLGGGEAEAALGRAAGQVLQAEASAPAFRR